MKQIMLLLILILVFVAAPLLLPAETEEEMMTIQSDEFSLFQRPHVKFSHDDHESDFACKMCHHPSSLDVDDESDIESCSACHMEEATKEVPIPLMDAFHMQCKGCHENYIKWGRDSGPVMCGSCHKK